MSDDGLSRRTFMRNSTLAAVGGVTAPLFNEAAGQEKTKGRMDTSVRKPNIVLICADQLRWDFIGANAANPTVRTPNLDAMAARGANFSKAMTNQPLCSPARACMITGCYATEAGVWKLNLELNPKLPTLASVLNENGYTTNFIGKWHLQEIDNGRTPPQRDLENRGFVKPENRGGFKGVWEGSNALELTSQPYAGTIWNGAGEKMEYKDMYRVDYLTQRAVHFLDQQEADKPFFLFLSHLEPHQQNEVGQCIAPNGYAKRYQNPFVPEDLRPYPGDWQKVMPDYYGCIEKIDESVGTVLNTLQKKDLLENTIVAFISDHGCHFRTRAVEYKRSPHDSSIRVPFIFQGPGFDHGGRRDEIVTMVDLAPTLLEAAGISAPTTMKGRNFQPLLTDIHARSQWENIAYVQVSDAMTARAVRTDQWLYAAVDRGLMGLEAPAGKNYEDYLLYDMYADPAQQINLVARPQYKVVANEMRTLLEKKMVAAGEEPADIKPAHLYD
ncbi:MAG: sulfatase-like hydrolase/transferase [Acidobacteriaceae bacterium]|nr:sulfatase-like hydrolase/transferase [Acidobacteriaceae bacterium]